MSTRRFVLASACAVALASAIGATPVAGQSKPAAPAATLPDLTGLWDGAPGGNTRDLAKYMKSQGQTIPFTALGAERYKKVDMAQNPNGFFELALFKINQTKVRVNLGHSRLELPQLFEGLLGV